MYFITEYSAEVSEYSAEVWEYWAEVSEYSAEVSEYSAEVSEDLLLTMPRPPAAAEIFSAQWGRLQPRSTEDPLVRGGRRLSIYISLDSLDNPESPT